jgi:ferric-dicitrate binding protein FerR (iron transport regulator)
MILDGARTLVRALRSGGLRGALWLRWTGGRRPDNGYNGGGALDDRRAWDLLVRDAAGRVTPREAELLAAMCEEEPERERLRRRIARLVSTSRALDSADHMARAWQRVARRMHDAEHEPRILRVRPPRLEPVLPDASAQQRSRRALVAAALITVAAAGGGAWYWKSSRPPEVREVVTRRGERMELGLPDGSRVLLGAASRLEFTPDRFAEERMLTLDGEAYFAVARDSAHPFIVRASGSVVQALGTEFGVRAHARDSLVQVAVAQGRVLLRPQSAEPGTGTVLDHGDVGELDAKGRVAVHRGVDLLPYLGWVRGRLIYDMAPALAVVRDLERWYDLTINTDDVVLDGLRVTMTIDPTGPPPVALRRLAEVLGLGVTQDEQQARFTRRRRARP